MRSHSKLLLVFASTFLVSSCSDQRKLAVEVTKNIQSPTAYSLTHESSLELLVTAQDEKSFEESVERIRNFRHENMDWAKFWDSLDQNLKYLGLTNKQKVSTLVLAGAVCAEKSDLSFLEHIRKLYLSLNEQDLKKLLRDEVLRYFDSCSLDRVAIVQKSLFDLFETSYLNDEDLSGLLKHLQILMAQGQVELVKSKWAQLMADLPQDLARKNSYQDLVSLAQMGKQLFPFRPDLSRAALRPLLKNSTMIEDVLLMMDHHDALLFIDYAHRQAEAQLDLKALYLIYLNGLSKLDQETRSQVAFLQKLDQVASNLSEVADSLSTTDLLFLLTKMDLLLNDSTEQMEHLKERYEQTAFYQLLALRRIEKLRLKEKDFSEMSFPRYGLLEDLVAHYIALSQGRREAREKFCSQMPVKEIAANQLKNEIGMIGCLLIKDSEEKTLELSFNKLDLAIGAVVVAPGMDLKIHAQSIKGLVVDLSTDFKYANQVSEATPEDYDAIVIPLVFGMKTQQERSVFFVDQTYYLSYHFEYRQAKTGPATEGQALKGRDGGNLEIQVPNKSIDSVIFISEGGEGQKAATARKGGLARTSILSERDLERWVLRFTNSDLVVESLKSPKELQTLFDIAERNEDGRIKIYLEPSYTDLLKHEAQKKLLNDLEVINTDLGLTCPDSICVLSKVTEMALSQLSFKLADLGATIGTGVIRELEQMFTSPEGQEGAVDVDGSKGENGEKNIIHI